ncbi:glucose-1-phosphatase/inositol phosphatase [Salmonella enterica subsp. enterica]|nr:glucose-1-phosphatase/inositol phosphatase [Salmonella enterica subsp. enterica]
MDPTFNPVITDDSAAFRQQAVQAMEKARSQLHLDESYKLLEQITHYQDSPSCKEKHQCSLIDAKIPSARTISKSLACRGRLK